MAGGSDAVHPPPASACNNTYMNVCLQALHRLRIIYGLLSIMARKTKEDAQATREDILNAAETCFLEHGVFRTSLEMIAAQAGYTRGAVYWHFRNKIEVLDAVIDRGQAPLLMGLDNIVWRDTVTPLRSLLRVVRESSVQLGTDTYIRKAAEILELRCEFVEETRRVFERHRQGYRYADANLRSAFERAAELGQLCPGVSVETCANMLMFIFVGAFNTHLLDSDRVDLETSVIASFKVALRGMVKADLLEQILE